MLKSVMLALMSIGLIVFVVGVVLLIPQGQSSAQSDNTCRTFSETGKMICGKFLAFWQKNGALSIFGYPISNPFQEIVSIQVLDLMGQMRIIFLFIRAPKT